MNFELVETQEKIDQVVDILKNEKWIALDTEFVGEKRYFPLLCLIQIATSSNNYIIDTLKVKNLTGFLSLISNPEILKITHAGENDYRLFYNLFGVIPQNIFDIQIAYGFISHIYPISYQKIAEKEVGIRVKKNYSVTDWEARPLNPSQLLYALNDVLHLYPIYEKVATKIKKKNRIDWLFQELHLLTQEEFYQKDSNKEFLSSGFLNELNEKEKVFLMRLFQWRDTNASQTNQSKEMFFPTKMIHTFVKNFSAGKEVLKSDRRIPDKQLYKYWDIFKNLYDKPITQDEKKVLTQIEPYIELSNEQEMTIDAIFWAIKYQCWVEEIAISMVMPKNILKKLMAEPAFEISDLKSGWRRNLLGGTIARWLEKRNIIQCEFLSEDSLLLTMV